MAFPENLQYIRAQAGVTQEQLAEQLDVTRQSVSKWEGGLSFPEMDTLLRLCDLYSVNLDVLLRGSVEQSRVSDTANYDAFMNRFALRMSLAIAGVLAGLGLAALMQEAQVADLWCGAAFLLILGICTVVMTACGLQMEYFRKKHPVLADFYSEEERDAFHQRFIWHIAGGVGVMLFAPALAAVLQSVRPAAWDGWTGALFLFVAAGATWSFVYGGLQQDKYDVERYNRENNPSPEEKRRIQLIGTACGALMTLAAAVYVGLGLALDLWKTAWWILVVAGVLCGVVAILLNPYKNET